MPFIFIQSSHIQAYHAAILIVLHVLSRKRPRPRRAEVGAGCWSSGWGSPTGVAVWSICQDGRKVSPNGWAKEYNAGSWRVSLFSPFSLGDGVGKSPIVPWGRNDLPNLPGDPGLRWRFFCQDSRATAGYAFVFHMVNASIIWNARSISDQPLVLAKWPSWIWLFDGLKKTKYAFQMVMLNDELPLQRKCRTIKHPTKQTNKQWNNQTIKPSNKKQYPETNTLRNKHPPRLLVPPINVDKSSPSQK